MFKLFGGNFNDLGGMPSGYIDTLFDALNAALIGGKKYNGGYYSDLPNLIDKIEDDDIIFWMPNIPNDKPKLIAEIKNRCQKGVLITSKTNSEDKYSIHELISRALSSKSNLFIEFKKKEKVEASLLDPLGNIFIKTYYIEELAAAIAKRVMELKSFTRLNSVCADFNSQVPKISETFLNIVKDYAKVFDEFVHSPNKERFLGNVSFRCAHGFPSVKIEETVYVSRRNIDKKDITAEGFVPVHLNKDLMAVYYKGYHKPSVDTPIQLMLYNYYPKIRFMIHSHVYIKEAAVTTSLIPCGAIEEFYEIISLYPSRNTAFMKINLLGHGSIILADTQERFIEEPIEFMPRHIPEPSNIALTLIRLRGD